MSMGIPNDVIGRLTGKTVARAARGIDSDDRVYIQIEFTDGSTLRVFGWESYEVFEAAPRS